MIQRIQTVFLLLALALIVSCFFLPVAELASKTGELYHYNLKGFLLVKGEPAGLFIRQTSMMLTGILIGIITFISIFLYKHRVIQMRLSIYNIILMVGLNLMIYFVIANVKKEMLLVVHYNIASVFPFIAAVFTYLAYRGILKDDRLVKLMDRIR